MAKLASPPLLEVLLELHWGQTIADAGAQAFQFGPEDQDLFFGQFTGVARSEGFSFAERLLPPGISIPHKPTYRLREKADSYPVYQVGLGMFSANQIGSGYSWEGFRKTCENGLRFLGTGHPRGIEALAPIRAILKYRDVFQLQGKSGVDFIRGNLNIGLTLPDDMLGDEIALGGVEGVALRFSRKLPEINGSVSVSVQEGLVNGASSIILDTDVISDGEAFGGKFTVQGVLDWLDAGHKMQQQAFTSLIKPASLKAME